MQIDFSNNYFELFDQPVGFTIDDAALTQRYRELQQVLHPDRYAAATDAERRWSVQAASLVNEAYQALRSPLSRAVYLLSLNGISIDEETDTAMAPAFLMEQMELREAMDDAGSAADPLAALDEVSARLSSLGRDIADRFARAAGSGDWRDAREQVRQWQFIDKMRRDVRTMESRFDT